MSASERPGCHCSDCLKADKVYRFNCPDCPPDLDGHHIAGENRAKSITANHKHDAASLELVWADGRVLGSDGGQLRTDGGGGYRDRQSLDYDVDKRFAHLRIEVLGKKYTDVVRVREQFPGLPDGITVYVEHVDAIDLKSNTKSKRPVEHLLCTVCGTNPSYALIDGEGFLVCHCSHVGGSMDPWPVHGFHGHPEEWEFVLEGVDG